MAFESSMIIAGRKGFVDAAKAGFSHESSNDEFENYVRANTAPLTEPFMKAEDDSSERRLNGWVWYAVGIIGQSLMYIEKLDNRPNSEE